IEVPRTAAASGLEDGQPAVGNANERLPFCCFDAPVVPSSPEAAKNESPFAIPRWYVCSKREVWTHLAPPNVCSATPRLSEKTVPEGYVSIAWSIALKMFGKPCTPSVSAGGTGSRTMCDFGAIAYAHWTSSAASPAQPAAAPGPDWPLAFGLPFS